VFIFFNIKLETLQTAARVSFIQNVNTVQDCSQRFPENRDYLRWTSRVLSTREIDAHMLEENISQLEKHLSVFLLPEERDLVLTFLARGREASAGLGSSTNPPSDDKWA
jgi:hypothetical protein